MEYADLLVVIFILIATTLNRQSFIFLFAFVVCEILFISGLNDVNYAITASLTFCFLVVGFPKISNGLSVALIIYAILFWFSALDYLLFPHETVFYVIFPYVIKLVDCYVIFNLINKGGQWHGAYNRPFSRAWFQRLAGL